MGIAWKQEMSKILVSTEVWEKLSSTEWNYLPLNVDFVSESAAFPKLIWPQTVFSNGPFFVTNCPQNPPWKMLHWSHCSLQMKKLRFSQGLAQNHTGRWYPSWEVGPRSSTLRLTTVPHCLSVTHSTESPVLSCPSTRHGVSLHITFSTPILNPLSAAAFWCLLSWAPASALPCIHLHLSCQY